MFAIYFFTLFPDNVLPVTSSVLMLKENLSGRFGIFHGWIGVFHSVQAIEQRIIILCLKNGFSHNKDKIKKITLYCQLSQDRGLMHNGPQRGKVGS